MQQVYLSATSRYGYGYGLFTRGVIALPLKVEEVDRLEAMPFEEAKDYVKTRWRFELIRHPKSRSGCKCDPCSVWYGNGCDAHEG